MTAPDTLTSGRAVQGDWDDGNGPGVALADLLTWLGHGKRLIALVTLAAAAAGAVVAMVLPKEYTAHATMLPPGSQQQSGSAAALAALGSLTGLAGAAAKSPDELYVALLKSDSVVRALDQRFGLKARYDVSDFEALRKVIQNHVRVAVDKKSGLISVDVDDQDPGFAAELANAHVGEVTRVLGRLAVSEAQMRRIFFEKQLQDTKENLVKAEQNLQDVQEKSGVIVLDKQAEALITSAAQLRAAIAEREVQLKVLRTSATEQNPDVMRLNSEMRAMRAELARLDSRQPSADGSAMELPVGRLPAAGIDYVRARRELKLQETLLESMVRQLEVAKLDEAKEGQALQEVDVALPPDHKSKPQRLLITLGAAVFGLLAGSAYVIVRRYGAWTRAHDPESAAARDALTRAWRWRA
ncbi:MAG: Wzz/FepE/Etk N-terminal domain-containing protein [Pseudomonadota bacterium]|nr:Wzz/FepE/Etk N-terminal domain-containing protein [Pseudomonadota bacterium]